MSITTRITLATKAILREAGCINEAEAVRAKRESQPSTPVCK